MLFIAKDIELTNTTMKASKTATLNICVLGDKTSNLTTFIQKNNVGKQALGKKV